MQAVRICEIPDCKMVSSEVGMFGDGKLERFDAWFSTLPRPVFPRDYLYWDGEPMKTGGFRWLVLYEPWMDVPDAFQIVDFKGGLYAVATDIDGQTDVKAMDNEKDAFLAAHGLERDPSRPEMGNVVTPPAARSAMGFSQMDYYTPVRAAAGRADTESTETARG